MMMPLFAKTNLALQLPKLNAHLHQSVRGGCNQQQRKKEVVSSVIQPEMDTNVLSCLCLMCNIEAKMQHLKFVLCTM